MIKIQDPRHILLGGKKEKNIILFLDMDGVCTFWEKSAAKSCDVDYDDKDIRSQLKSEEKKIEDFVEGGEEEMWRIIEKEGDDWWENMEKLPWADRLFDFCKKETDEVFYLSSPSNDPGCASGKIKWLKKNHGNKFKDFLLGYPKWACAGADKILIDDNTTKGERFVEAGGNWFKWPNPISILDGDVDIDKVFEDLKKEIDKIKNEK